MQKKRSLFSAILGLIIALVFVGFAIIAFLNDYLVMLFGIIPLNWIACSVIAVLLLAWSIWDIVRVAEQRRRQ